MQGPAPNYKLLGYFWFNFESGAAFKVSQLPEPPAEVAKEELIEFETVDRSKGDPELGQAPLSDIFARASSAKDRKRRLIVAQGVIAITSTSSNGLAVTYLRDDGYYLREMVKADPKFTERLKKAN